ncbi:S8 family peptidase [Mucilaginibacter glaciei]|uniref:S8 family peptidase n=1 Tax=Mucilaginibacter glaciei TaxID=2772109 RepID=A0A926NNR4_9SPHI|nr:S8 family peptidase [Mucilaginibacter glaciei]MBD1395489.1 S8 family peptidase [Mucilaginibacter glaciei]
MIKRFACFLFCLCSFHFSWGQTIADDQLIAKTYAASPDIQPVKPGTDRYYLVRFKGVPNKQLHLLKQISRNYYVVTSRDSLPADKNILSATPANSLWKADDGLAQLTQKRPGTTRLVDLVIKQKSPALLNELSNTGDIIATSGNIITLKVALKKLPALLNNTAIEFAGMQRRAHEELVINDIDLGSNNLSAIADNYPAINGTGINVSVKEEKYDLTDLDLLGRSFTSITPSDKVTGHATIMATLIGGNGNSFIRGLGAAPTVKFTSSTFARLLPDTITIFRSNNISVQNHSYGTGIENFYGIEAQAYDKQIYEADTLIHVFSSGNIGTSTPATGVYKGLANMANLSGTFKQAKNVIVVGGTNRLNIPEALSSSGPAYDGRIKPEVIAGGEDGTSGAAALTSGTVALLQQAYKKQTGKLPSAALIKSVLINAADDIGLPNPDHKTGYGKLNGLEAVRTITDNRFKIGSLANRQQLTYQITVPANSREFKVSLAWNDIAAALNAPSALINDLDLSVRSPSGQVILPWTLSSFPNIDSLVKPAKHSRDSLNNTEQVSIPNPDAGVYTVTISARNITTPVQAFYIAYQTKLSDQFEWTYPSGSNQLFAAEDNYLRWQNTHNAASGTLSISYDHGATYNKVADLAPANNLYQFAAPDVFTRAILKMTVNGTDHISKEFSLSKPLNVNVGFDCADGTLLHWNPQPGATGYVVYTIKDNILQKLTTATDTSVVIPVQMQISKYFAVSALGNGFEGLKSFTINATTQGVGCYVKTLLANVIDDKSIGLTLSLGSIVNLKSITWERLTGTNTFTTLGNTIINPNALTYNFTDAAPKKGLNYYRATLTTTDGRSIYSDLANATLLQSNQFTLYPNPVTTQVTILTGEQKDFEIKFYDMAGKLSLTKTFNGLQNTVPVNLIPGSYAYAITLGGKTISTGKILKAL